MNAKFLEKARKVIPDPRKLVIIASRRAKHLTRGARPMVRTTDDNPLNVALLEIGEGLITFEEPKETKESKESKK
ncbi:MAG TPA: DNA-directed RNA polymerase subunit omega [Lentisphaeria bacterium]|nr:MAG: DNA-directed RNA polymerase subunit omega [Lentisphaerae bacterium GWF2_49_21]HBC87400.1 DNA-directed RNA polymerase subunit omega [Lentisphaeria bacterium]